PPAALLPYSALFRSRQHARLPGAGLLPAGLAPGLRRPAAAGGGGAYRRPGDVRAAAARHAGHDPRQGIERDGRLPGAAAARTSRSEEHTSALPALTN